MEPLQRRYERAGAARITRRGVRSGPPLSAADVVELRPGPGRAAGAAVGRRAGFTPCGVTPPHPVAVGRPQGTDRRTSEDVAMTAQTATRARRAPRPLSAEETSKLLALTKGADTVELKLTVPETRSGFHSTVAALEIDPLDAQLRQVFFFDTPDLLLNKSGVVVRARRSQGGSTTPSSSSGRSSPTMPADSGSSRTSGSRSTRCPVASCARHRSRRSWTAPACGRWPSDTTDPQALHQGAEGVLRPARPGGDRARRPERARADERAEAEVHPEGFARRLVAELWLYPDGSRILELSTKCPPTEAFQAAAEAGRSSATAASTSPASSRPRPPPR